MKYYVIIPAYNEAAFISTMLQSLAQQSVLPAKAVVVNDNSTDDTAKITQSFCTKHQWLSLVNKTSETVHMPGSKVIQAFMAGYETVDEDYDIIVKLDADLILPHDYFEKVLDVFSKNKKAGMAGGFAYIEHNGEWMLENLTDKDHIRGAFKAYRKECFLQIGKLKPAMGWDTVDELLAKFYGWEVVTIDSLKVKHLKPTGASYTKASRYKQGEAFYTLGYGFTITAIAAAKLAMRKKKPFLFADYIKGFLKAKRERKELLVTKEQAAYIRNYRWKKIKGKLF
ncbi:glycosyltransferase family 2 protein [Flavobacterium salilacus subsp. salilacus]|uniref:glycosyltransferase family 2 protein n=1 Tax=Flavobacterium TaxID=237 RepID=UPI0010754619|nr:MULTISPECIES: glycosyltransferase family A protein [Flavobacterium]KAF2519612.1 glycosyltransferase family 2 protein [Flavobacterium salilacus subsp. salilacus]MBE1614486.1 glycosyltransferase family 2 protein [Flavobacterium sp. SaA2.13]NDI98451.1 glycosyltransferase family 2 protein [Flavobacterium salilacus subsp. altitudinum]